MKSSILFLLFVTSGFSQFTPAVKPTQAATVESLTAEVESLKAQLAQLQTTAAFELRLCNAAVLAAREFVVGPKPSGPQRPASTNPRSQLPRVPIPESAPEAAEAEAAKKKP